MVRCIALALYTIPQTSPSGIAIRWMLIDRVIGDSTSAEKPTTPPRAPIYTIPRRGACRTRRYPSTIAVRGGSRYPTNPNTPDSASDAVHTLCRKLPYATLRPVASSSIWIPNPCPITGFDSQISNSRFNPGIRDVHALLDTPICSPRSEEHTSELQSRLHLVCR